MRKPHDGHACYFEFTNEWKCFLGSPDFDKYNFRDLISLLPGFETQQQAKSWALDHPDWLFVAESELNKLAGTDDEPCAHELIQRARERRRCKYHSLHARNARTATTSASISGIVDPEFTGARPDRGDR